MGKIIKSALLVTILGLVGCASTPPVVETQIVKIPVLSCPVPRDIPRPSLAIDSLAKEDAKDPGKVVAAYKASVKALQGYIQELEKELGGYKDNGDK